jgi:hypothetical protein
MMYKLIFKDKLTTILTNIKTSTSIFLKIEFLIKFNITKIEKPDQKFKHSSLINASYVGNVFLLNFLKLTHVQSQ